MANPIRLIVAEDHTLVREGIIRLLEDSDEIVLVAEAENGEDLLEKYFRFSPDVVLSDIEMPKMRGFEVLNKTLSKDPGAKFIFLSIYSDEGYLYYAVKAKAYGLLSKSIKKSELIYAIKKVASGEKYFLGKSDREIKEIMDKYLVKERADNTVVNELTRREMDILFLLAEGLLSSQIAEKLNISKRTVDSHRARIAQKLNLSNSSELVSYAVKFRYKENS